MEDLTGDEVTQIYLKVAGGYTFEKSGITDTPANREAWRVLTEQVNSSKGILDIPYEMPDDPFKYPEPPVPK